MNNSTVTDMPTNANGTSIVGASRTNGVAAKSEAEDTPYTPYEVCQFFRWIEAVAKEFVIDKDKLAEKMETRIFYWEKMFEIDEKLMIWVISIY